jgi:hypothetical protein
MEFVYHIVAIRVNETSWAHVWRLRSRYLGTGYDTMSRQDEGHTTFVTVDGLYCYTSMPYGLTNVLSTFVRVMHKAFGDLIRDIVEVYVDDIVVKIKLDTSLLVNLALVFDRLHSMRIKLNPDKCVFGVFARKLLGFLILHRGIEANLEKIKAIKAMRPPSRIKDVKKLTGCLDVLSQFIPKLVERTLPFFKLLQKSEPFVWTQEVDEAFQELKRYVTSLLDMVAPEFGEPLMLYIVARTKVVSMVLAVEWPKP